MRAWLDARTKDEAVVSAARRRLVEYGLPEERLLRFPADQVILLDEKREFEVRFDDVMKTINLPCLAGRSAGRPDQGEEGSRHCSPMPWCRPSTSVRRAQARLDQRIALLRHVEALRLYAAEHDGTLPAKLSDVSVPLPVDPFTGKPFRYEVSGNTAHLRGTSARGRGKDPVFQHPLRGDPAEVAMSYEQVTARSCSSLTPGVFRNDSRSPCRRGAGRVSSNSRGEETVVRLTVRPMPAPKPALKYQLLPELGS